MTTAHNIVDLVEVYDLGEDGDAWLALGCDSVSIARVAIIRRLREQLGDDEAAFAQSVWTLLDLSPQHHVGWYFHDDGVHEAILRAAHCSTEDVQLMPGVAFGAPVITATMHPLSPVSDQAVPE